MIESDNSNKLTVREQFGALAMLFVPGTWSSLRRFAGVSVAAIIAASIPYLWVLWDLWTGTINPLRVNGSDNNPIYDVQARAIMHGHLSLPDGKIGLLAFVHDSGQYTYFGIFPSLLRIPIFPLHPVTRRAAHCVVPVGGVGCHRHLRLSAAVAAPDPPSW